ncbi:hypothetical protein ACHAWF_007386 [Thalassiosira exigua]
MAAPDGVGGGAVVPVRVVVLDRVPPIGVGGGRRDDDDDDRGRSGRRRRRPGTDGGGEGEADGVVERRRGRSGPGSGSRSRGRGKVVGRRRPRDEHATVYASGGEVAALLSRLRGSTGGSRERERGPEREREGGTTCRLLRPVGSDDDDDGAAARDLLDVDGRGSFLWAPVVLRRMPADGGDDEGGGGSGDDEDNGDGDDGTKSGEGGTPTLHVPPCLAAALGLRSFRDSFPSGGGASSRRAHLQLLPRARIVEASRATLREMAPLPPEPRPRRPGESAGSDAEEEEDDAHLRRFFLRPPRRRRGTGGTADGRSARRPRRGKPPRPRGRLLAPGSIFATPVCDDDEEDDSATCRKIRSVRFYQLVDARSAQEGADEDGGGTNDGGNAFGTARGNAYAVSPRTHLTLLPPVDCDEADDASLHPQLGGFPASGGRAWRLPRPSAALSFLRSIEDNEKGDEGRSGRKRTRGRMPSSAMHPSARDLAEALYLRGVASTARRGGGGGMRPRRCPACRDACGAPSQLPKAATEDVDARVVYLIGTDEDHAGECVDQAADLMGMRSFHVDGLAAFWAHRTALGTYPSARRSQRPAPPLTGSLADKLRGLSAALDVARRSAPCVLRVALDGELSPADGPDGDRDARDDEERRMLEAIRAGLSAGAGGDGGAGAARRGLAAPAPGVARGMATDAFPTDATAPPVVAVLCAKKAPRPGPFASALLGGSAVTLKGPDEAYARALWDDDADGTFDAVKTHLRGRTARDVVHLRTMFAPLWRSEPEGQLEERPRRSPVDVLRSLLPRLEAAQNLARPKGGEGSARPLAVLPDVRWSDVGGSESIRSEISDAVELPLRRPDLFASMSRRSGVLLFGPPGTGKTLVAKAVANSCGLPFLSVKGPELLGSFVGESEANVRGVFAAAREAAASVRGGGCGGGDGRGGEGTTDEGGGGGAVLFFDELDSLAPRRGETDHGDGVMDRVVATLLGELDGGGGGGGDASRSGSSPPNVVVIGATNRPDLLDPSLLRPGRFDRLLYLGPATTKERCLQILLAQTRKFHFEEGQDAKAVLRRAAESFPPTLSGADLSAVASEALTRALRRVCARVEEEVRSADAVNNAEEGAGGDSATAVADVDDVMRAWGPERLRPTVTAADFAEAARAVVPSVSERDLEGFERLRVQFSSSEFL